MKPKFRKGQIVHCYTKEGFNYLESTEYLLILKVYKGIGDIPLYKVWSIREGFMTDTYLNRKDVWNYKVYKHE